MTALMAVSLSLLMIGTAFLSGIFGMAGGLILIGVLLVVFPLPTAMVLHAITQMASNGWRALLWWRYIEWKSTAFYVAGWTGSTCGSNPPAPFAVKKGAIWGHFIKYAAPDPKSTGTEACERESITPCIPVMTR